MVRLRWGVWCSAVAVLGVTACSPDVATGPGPDIKRLVQAGLPQASVTSGRLTATAANANTCDVGTAIRDASGKFQRWEASRKKVNIRPNQDTSDVAVYRMIMFDQSNRSSMLVHCVLPKGDEASAFAREYFKPKVENPRRGLRVSHLDWLSLMCGSVIDGWFTCSYNGVGFKCPVPTLAIGEDEMLRLDNRLTFAPQARRARPGRANSQEACVAVGGSWESPPPLNAPPPPPEQPTDAGYMSYSPPPGGFSVGTTLPDGSWEYSPPINVNCALGGCGPGKGNECYATIRVQGTVVAHDCLMPPPPEDDYTPSPLPGTEEELLAQAGCESINDCLSKLRQIVVNGAGQLTPQEADDMITKIRDDITAMAGHGATRMQWLAVITQCIKYHTLEIAIPNGFVGWARTMWAPNPLQGARYAKKIMDQINAHPEDRRHNFSWMADIMAAAYTDIRYCLGEDGLTHKWIYLRGGMHTLESGDIEGEYTWEIKPAVGGDGPIIGKRYFRPLNEPRLPINC